MIAPWEHGGPAARRAAELRRLLGEVPGFAWSSAHRAGLDLGATRAEVRVETPEHLVLRVRRAACDGGPRTALVVSHGFRGNLRHARAAGEELLVADLATGAPAALRAALDEVLGDLAGEGARASRPAAPAAGEDDRAGALAAALAELAADGMGVVDRPGGGELRVVLGRRGHAVQVTVGEHGVRLSSRLVRDLPGGRGGEALSDWALRANARSSLARLACADGALVAETFLAPGPPSSSRVAAAAWAVAALAERARLPAQLLLTERRVALGYARCFLDPKAREQAGGD